MKHLEYKLSFNMFIFSSISMTQQLRGSLHEWQLLLLVAAVAVGLSNCWESNWHVTLEEELAPTLAGKQQCQHEMLKRSRYNGTGESGAAGKTVSQLVCQ